MKSTENNPEKFDIEEFSSIVSHDFRAPIRHINQFVTILVDTLEQVDEDQQRYIEHIKSSISHCNDMMNGLAQLANIGRSAEKNSAVDCAGEFVSCVRKLELVYGHNADISMQVDNNETLLIQPAHLKDLLYVITDNCFKFRDASKKLAINLDIICNTEYIFITITDNGMGIPENFIAQSTAVFAQYSRSTCGVGIGLTHASHIAKHYGGILSIENNKQGFGVQIEIRLPLAQCADIA